VFRSPSPNRSGPVRPASYGAAPMGAPMGVRSPSPVIVTGTGPSGGGGRMVPPPNAPGGVSAPTGAGVGAGAGMYAPLSVRGVAAAASAAGPPVMKVPVRLGTRSPSPGASAGGVGGVGGASVGGQGSSKW
jgi:hypothetical protein